MADEPILEEELAEENDVISEKGYAYSNKQLDKCGKIGDLSIGKHVSSKVIPANCINEGATDSKEVANLHDGDTGSDGKRDKIEMAMDDKVVAMDGRTPQVGMVFKSYEEVVSFYKLYALRVGFGVAVKKSSFTTYGLCRRLVLVCTKGGKGRENACYQSRPTAKTDCRAMIVVKLWGDGLLHLMEAHVEHNHPTNPSSARFLKCYKKMSCRMTNMIARASGHEGISLDDRESLNFMDGGRLKLEEGDNEAIHQFFARMQAKNPNFFYLMDLDTEGRLRNVFWADARSRASYQHFGDVISFDTSCLKYKFNIPLVLFLGTNHHGQSILLGCGFVAEQIVENYTWLLKTWLTCMNGSVPNAVITDESEMIKEAISDVFPKARHRICLWRMMKSVKEKLKEYAEHKTIKRALNRVVFESCQVDEFEEKWSELIKGFGLKGDDLFNSLYELRSFWIPAFLKDTFWAGMSITHYKERINSFFEGYLYLETCLKEFLSKYEVSLQSKYETEAQADYESLYNAGIFVSKYHMEEQLSKLYSLNIFKVFQDELKGGLYCQVSLIKVDASSSTYKVRECAFINEIEKAENKDYDVLYIVDGFQVHCSCGFFQFRGILCRHALSVLKLQQVYDIPARYIIDRWRKDFKQLNLISRKLKDGLNNSNSMERYDNLSMRCLSLVDIGVMSDEKYQLALKLIREVEKSLLDDNLFRDLQRKLLPFDNRLSESDENHASHEYGMYEESKNSPALPMKRRGRPPKKVKETSLETLPSSSKRKDNLGTSLIDNQNSFLQASPNASQLGAQIRIPGGVNLEEVNPNELSFGNHYGIHATPPDIMSNHSTLQSANALQNQFGQQNLGNQQAVQWFYQPFFQEDQSPFGRRPG
ncbi:protein FAR1-RELATED SEQUENCE 6 isoform X1 [Dendrobium catenatum]|uniref:protein FAR1-RELATED SEQUENCE 6 isoform X1 n=2 Tax=Dendrobium catenatum TaxID=906689 RepID=UPI0009F6B745|nr:protein FAR1-RELATED SEQUENCE 6 isoform X1 [Dendrobium catenatum]XP_028555866.1 protein FAR1-RELATED SEQUENCE 6 isoform X1 [Dendrobium catenatum]